MRHIKFFSILFQVIITQYAVGQNSAHPAYDTLPHVRGLNQQFDLLNNIRCVTSLFAKNFTVKDSLGNIYVHLYYNTDNHEDFPIQLKITGNFIWGVSYSFALEPYIDYLEESHTYFIVSAFDKDGKMINTEFYAFRKYHLNDQKNFMKNKLEHIRIPNTWGIVDKSYQIVYYCSEPTERKNFYKYLLLVLNRLKLLNEECDTWKEAYVGCSGLEFEAVSIKLPK